MMIVCPHCHTRNRLQTSRLVNTPQCGACHQSLFSLPIPLVGNQLNEMTAQSVLPVIVDFWGDWCGPCKNFAPIFAEICKQMQGRMVFAKVDVDAEVEVAQHYQIRSIPTLIAFKHGREVDRISGVLSKLQLMNFVNRTI